MMSLFPMVLAASLMLAPNRPTAPAAVLLQPTITPGEFLPGLALSLAAGLLIGIERGWTMRRAPAGARVAGIRTFAILGLFGGLTGLAITGPMAGPALVLFAAAALAVLVGYWGDMSRKGHVSATSALAALITLTLGATATAGHPAVASVGAGAVVILLASRKALHAALAYTSEADLKALLRLVIVIFVILPLIPDVGLGPYGLNPRRIWFVVVICGGISFVGYVLARWLGSRKGALLTASVGAMVSSTAVTLECARRIREEGSNPAQDTAIAIAQVVMMSRALLLVTVLAPRYLGALAGLLLPAIFTGSLMAAALYWRSQRSAATIEATELKPPGLGLALLFAATVAVITTIAGWAAQEYGQTSAAVVIAIAGLADIDSAIAALGSLPPDTFPADLAVYIIGAPVLFNSLFKLTIVASVAGLRRARAGAASLGAAALVLVAVAGWIYIN